MPPDPPTVPIVVDSRKDHGSFQMTRCSYLSIQSTKPLRDWDLHIRGTHLPILLLNLEAVVYQPLSPHAITHFSSPDHFEGLWTAVEDAGLEVVIEELWLPNFAFRHIDPEPGHVYRILDKLFAEAAALRDGRSDFETLASLIERTEDGVVFSEEETYSLAGWWRRHHDAAIEAFPKNDNLQLRWRRAEPEGDRR
jgi:hypothetical protein